MFFKIITSNFLTTASYNRCFPSLLDFTSSLRIAFAVLQKPCQENFSKFHIFGESRFGGSEKDRYFLKILKWQHELAGDFKRGKLVSYFLNNDAKTYLHGLKIWENIEIEQVFQSRAFFISVAIHTSCFSAFKIKTFSIAVHYDIELKT